MLYTKKHTFLLVIYVLVSACYSTRKKCIAQNTEQNSFIFATRTAGSRLSIIHEGDLSSTIQLDSLLRYKNLYALGPLVGLKGEVTIYNGKASFATVVDDQPQIDTNLIGKEAIFLAYANIPAWTEKTIENRLSSQAQIEAMVKKEANAKGRSTAQPFVFRLEGKVDSLHYHIIYKTSSTQHNKAEHQKAKRRFTLSNTYVKIVGFWADAAGEGVYTHPGKRIHLHFITADHQFSGHIDTISLSARAKLFLPD